MFLEEAIPPPFLRLIFLISSSRSSILERDNSDRSSRESSGSAHSTHSKSLEGATEVRLRLAFLVRRSKITSCVTSQSLARDSLLPKPFKMLLSI